MSRLDHRLNAYRDDLADAQLKGRVVAARFVEGTPGEIVAGVADLLSKPETGASLDRQALKGEQVRVFETVNGFSWISRDIDGYVGYVDAADVAKPATPKTHIVSVPRTFVYPAADLRFRHIGQLSMGAKVVVKGEAETRGTLYNILENDSAVIAAHLRPVDDHGSDFVSVAETLIYTPYLWGGNSGFGIDCAGLVQLSMLMAGKAVPADSDMQALSIGTPLDTQDHTYNNLQRGDLVFWKGHVGIMQDEKTLLHSSGHTMNVACEPLMDAVGRIAYLYDYPTIVRRP